MEMMEAGIVSLDTHPDPKLATVPTAHPFQRLSGPKKSMAASPCRCEREERIARSSLTFVLRTQAPASWVEATNSVCKAEWRACQPP